MERTIKLKVVLSASVAQVWQAITTAEILGKWFMENDFKLTLGHEFTFRMAPQKGWDGITHCKVTDLVPEQRLTYTYQGTATGEKSLACAGIHSDAAYRVAKGIFAQLDTVLTFTLTPTCGGSILELQHSGFRGAKMVLISFVFGMGWKKQLKKLQLLLQRAGDAA
jgi:uncharacterized protein YndB with AHSA1/START domain